jgi:tRNA(adenine34) deaminase
MDAALDQARLALGHRDVPVGAVVTLDGAVVVARHNERELDDDPTGHAEMRAIRDATRALGRDIARATLVVTLEPCVMCAGAIRTAGVGTVVFGAFDERQGAGGSRYDILRDPRLGNVPEVRSGVRSDEATTLLRAFFAQRRDRRSDLRLESAVVPADPSTPRGDAGRAGHAVPTTRPEIAQ